MKAIRIVVCALMACAAAASAASIEQILDITVSGVYQGVPVASRGLEHDRPQAFSITSATMVRALAIDYDTNFYTGTLIYKTALDGSITNVVIRQKGKTNELDVTSNFTFVPGPFIVDQVFNTNTLVTTGHVETGLLAISFRSSSAVFDCFPSYGTSARTRNMVTGRVNGVTVSGYANVLSYSGGGGLAAINTNIYSRVTGQFADTNLVSGVVRVQSFKTFSPAISANDPTAPAPN